MPHCSAVTSPPSSSCSGAWLSTCTHRGQRAVVGDEHRRVDVDLALLQVPVRPHLALRRPRPPGGPAARASPTAVGIHGPTATTTCSTAIGPAEVCTRVTAPEPSSSKPVTSTPSSISRPRRARLGREAEHRVAVVGEAARPLVQADAEPRGAPVVEERAHVRRDLGLAEDELRRVADLLLALVDGREVVDLGAVAEGDVPRAVVGERLRVGLPDLDARGHQLGHRGLEVVVAHDAAGDARGAGGDAGLVDDEDLLALLGEVPGGGEAVHARADDEVRSACACQ